MIFSWEWKTADEKDQESGSTTAQKGRTKLRKLAKEEDRESSLKRTGAREVHGLMGKTLGRGSAGLLEDKMQSGGDGEKCGGGKTSQFSGP